MPFLKIDIERYEMNKKKKKTNLEELYERMLKEYDKDHPGMRSLMRQINADKKYHEHDNGSFYSMFSMLQD
mgnify:FL=1